MKCIGRNRGLQRCRNDARVLFCHRHKWQPYKFLLLTIPTIFLLYYGIYEIYGKLITKDRFTKEETTIYGGFEKGDSTFNILILPFEPLENCTFKETNLEKAVFKELISLKEKENLDINVKFDSTQKCPTSFQEGAEIGIYLLADMIIWGDMYEKCNNDSFKTCLKYALIQRIDSNETIIIEVEDKVKSMTSTVEVKSGYLLKDINQIIYWTLSLQAFKNQYCDKALRYIDKVDTLEINTRMNIYNVKMVCLTKSNKLEEALFYCNKLIQLDSNNVHYLVNKGVILKKMGDTANANRIYTKALELDYGNKFVHYNFGMFYSRNSQLYKAIREFRAVIQLDSNYARAYYELGNLYRILNLNHIALLYYNKAIYINPFDADFYINRGVVYRSLNDQILALVDYNHALKINPNNSLLFYNRGNLFFFQKKYKVAIDDWEMAIKLNPILEDKLRERINHAKKQL